MYRLDSVRPLSQPKLSVATGLLTSRAGSGVYIRSHFRGRESVTGNDSSWPETVPAAFLSQVAGLWSNASKNGVIRAGGHAKEWPTEGTEESWAREILTVAALERAECSPSR